MDSTNSPGMTLREALQTKRLGHIFHVCVRRGNMVRVIVGPPDDLLQEALHGVPVGAALADVLDQPLAYLERRDDGSANMGVFGEKEGKDEVQILR